MSLHAIWHAIQAGIAGIGAWLAAYLGGLDGLVYALIVFTIADYITGVLAAINERRLSSSVGFRGISRKILIFTLVGLAHLIDVHILGAPGVLRAAVIFFYLSNEASPSWRTPPRLGLPVPSQMRGALDAIANRAETRPSLTEPPTTEKEIH